MKVLFSCSEAKHIDSNSPPLGKDSFSYGYELRLEMLQKYQDSINNFDTEQLKSLFGVSKESLVDEYRNIDIFKNGTKKAVERYSGVGFQYLDYESLYCDSQHFIDNNVIIFSNLFGSILAKDNIPHYKLKQGYKLDNIAIGKFYQQHFQKHIDDFIGDDLVVDLRAGAYNSFYDISSKYHIKVKFIKDNKIVSHHSKAYKGKLLRAMSQKEKLRDVHHLLNLPLDDMRYTDIIDNGKETTIIYENK